MQIVMKSIVALNRWTSCSWLMTIWVANKFHLLYLFLLSECALLLPHSIVIDSHRQLHELAGEGMPGIYLFTMHCSNVCPSP